MPRSQSNQVSAAGAADVQGQAIPQNYRCPGSFSDHEHGVGPSTTEVLSVLSAMERLLH
jgi:hypothetical protein